MKNIKYTVEKIINEKIGNDFLHRNISANLYHTVWSQLIDKISEEVHIKMIFQLKENVDNIVYSYKNLNNGKYQV